MIRHLRDVLARRRGEELTNESGFTLIELLIVIVVLGILAATVIFALTGVTGQSAQAACQSDAKSYEVAVAAYENSSTNPTGNAPANTDALVPTYLHAASNNSAFIVALGGDTVTDATTGVKQGKTGTTFNAATPDDGTVYVGKPGGTLVAFDSETGSNGCNGLSS
jgi:prepilin-type N-terminal cleavage/methylation domain-containing protein